MKSINPLMTPIEIRKALLDLNLSQAQIGRRIKVSRAYVNLIIHNKYPCKGPRSDRVRAAIARALNKDPSEIWADEAGAN